MLKAHIINAAWGPHVGHSHSSCTFHESSSWQVLQSSAVNSKTCSRSSDLVHNKSFSGRTGPGSLHARTFRPPPEATYVMILPRKNREILWVMQKPPSLSLSASLSHSHANKHTSTQTPPPLCCTPPSCAICQERREGIHWGLIHLSPAAPPPPPPPPCHDRCFWGPEEMRVCRG